MATSHTENCWDAVAEEMRWRRSTESSRKAQDQFGEPLSKSSPGLYVLCLAQLDAGSALMRSGCFSSRAVFVAELRRLITEPTTPSQPVPDLQAYRDAQKSWLGSLLRQYGHDG